MMNLCADGRSYYVGIMEYVWDGVVYDFIDNEEFFSAGNPYTNLIDDIPKYCYFSKAALAALNYMNWVPDIIHCHDWQSSLVPVYLRTLFEGTPVASARTMLTIHNLRFQGLYNIPTIRYWTGLPDYVFNKDALKQGYEDANMMKGGLTYCDIITTVSYTYAGEIQTPFYGDNLDAHLRYHSGKLRGIVNGIDYGTWNSATDPMLAVQYDITNVLPRKKENKRALQESLGLVQDDHVFVIGLISRLTDQKGLDLVNEILPSLIDGHTQVVVLGTGDWRYENSFRYFENVFKGSVCSNIMYDEGRAHMIYAGADALLVPSLFEPCGLTQLTAMHYGTVPIVRETGGLKDTVQPSTPMTAMDLPLTVMMRVFCSMPSTGPRRCISPIAGAGMKWYKETWPKMSPGTTRRSSTGICIWNLSRDLHNPGFAGQLHRGRLRAAKRSVRLLKKEV